MTVSLSLKQAWDALVPLTGDAAANALSLAAEQVIRAHVSRTATRQWHNVIPESEHQEFLDRVVGTLRARSSSLVAASDGAAASLIRQRVVWDVDAWMRRAARRIDKDPDTRPGAAPRSAPAVHDAWPEDPEDWRTGFDPDVAVEDVRRVVTERSRSNSMTPTTLAWLKEQRDGSLQRAELVARIAGEAGTGEEQAQQTFDTRVTRAGYAVIAELAQRRLRYELGQSAGRSNPPPGALSPSEFDATARRLVRLLWERPTNVAIERLRQARKGISSRGPSRKL
jgi:hypothetical protein